MKHKLILIVIFAAALAAPKVGPAQKIRNMTLIEVKHWAYVLQGLETPAVYRQVLSRPYDLYVLEPVLTEKGLRDFDAAGMVRRIREHNLKTRGVNPLVLAYVNLGQAEKWRWYFDESWRPGNPGWIAGEDPDGWQDNHSVAFWSPAWRRIMISGYKGASQLDAVLSAGFDGIFMDWVQAFSDPTVMKLAQEQNLDPKKAMFAFLEDIRKYARRTSAKARPDFLMIAQNAPELFFADPKRYTSVIDGFSAESVWYTGSYTGSSWEHPLGYNLPMDKLDPDWQAAHLEYLARIRERLPVFITEYAQDINGVNYASKVYRELAPAHGFKAFCTRRSLARLPDTPDPLDF